MQCTHSCFPTVNIWSREWHVIAQFVDSSEVNRHLMLDFNDQLYMKQAKRDILNVWIEENWREFK